MTGKEIWGLVSGLAIVALLLYGMVVQGASCQANQRAREVQIERIKHGCGEPSQADAP